MKLDHFVINVDEKYQKDTQIIEDIVNKGFPYKPKNGKGTKGFKASNLWIGNEYFELIHILKAHGGGWISEWTEAYNQGHRGMICMMLDVPDLDELYQSLNEKGIVTTLPQWLEFKWGFNLFTRRMPWKNSYVPFFEGVPFQIGFQQMKDQKTRDLMKQYMIPNSKENHINGIHEVIIEGAFTKADFDMISTIFEGKVSMNELSADKEPILKVQLSSKQSIEFIRSEKYEVIFYTDSNKGNVVEIENLKIYA